MCQFCINLNDTDQDHGLDTARSASSTSRGWRRNAHRLHTCGRSLPGPTFDILQIQKQILKLDPVLTVHMNHVCVHTLKKLKLMDNFCQGQ